MAKATVLFDGLINVTTEAIKLVKENKDLNLEKLESKILVENNNFLGIGFSLEYIYNDFVNMLFWFAKFNYNIYSSLYKITAGGAGAIDDLIKTTVTESSKIFSTVYQNFVPLIIVFIVGYALYVQGKHHKNFFITFFKWTVLVAFVGSVYSPIYGGESGVSVIYGKLSTFTAKVSSEASSGIAGIADVKDKGDTAYIDKTLAVYFDKALWQNYVGMNSDMVKDESGKLKSNLSTKQLIDLLDYKSGDNKFNIGGEKIYNFIGKQDEPKVKQLRGGLGNKFMYAILAILESGLTGMLLAGVGLMSLALRLIVLAIFYVLPVLLIAGVIPMFNGFLVGAMKGIGNNLLLSQFINVGGVFVMTFDTSVSNVFMTLTNDNFLLAFFGKWFSYLIAFLTRKWWLNALKPNSTSTIGRMLNKANSYGDKTRRTALKWGAAGVLGGLALANGTRRLAAERARVAKDKRMKQKAIKKYTGRGDDFELANMKADRDVEKVKLKRQEKSDKRKMLLNNPKDYISKMKQFGRKPSVKIPTEQRRQSLSNLNRKIRSRQKASGSNLKRVKQLAPKNKRKFVPGKPMYFPKDKRGASMNQMKNQRSLENPQKQLPQRSLTLKRKEKTNENKHLQKNITRNTLTKRDNFVNNGGKRRRNSRNTD
ncbi:hypothetical protein [Streptococcus sp. S784/96/1]|uniref:hypothetical protein n=1 Tax=Streptococcus sp. S784/96/1 TaxID=2653499 RepID=UPI001386E51C|nr:hypothetical protein [Streptococcus sp. S784/96/1]